MSVYFWGRVMALEGLPTARKMVLLVLANHVNKQSGKTYPSVDTIARKSGLSRRSVQKFLKDFVSEGVLEITGYVKGGRSPRVYAIDILRAEELYPPTPGNRSPKRESPAQVYKVASEPRGAAHDARGANDGKKGRKTPAPEPSLTVFNPGTPAVVGHKLSAAARDLWDARKNEVRSVFAAARLEFYMEDTVPNSDNGTTLVLATPTRTIRDKVERQLKPKLEQVLKRKITVEIPAR